MTRLALTLALLALYLTLAPMPMAAVSAREKVSVDALRKDFQALYAGLRDAHYNLYVNRQKAEYDARFTRDLAALNAPLTHREAAVRFQRFVAFGDVGHARIDYDRSAFEAYRADGGTLFPIYPRIVDGRVYVAENLSGIDDIRVGDEIVSINGRSVDEWLTLTARNLSADTPYMAHSLLEFLFPMYLWEEAGSLNRFTVGLRNAAGSVQTIDIAAMSRDQMEQHSASRHACFRLDSTAREAVMLKNNIAYLRPGPFYNAENPESAFDNANFVRFVDTGFEDFLEANASSLIIDLRENPGGDNSFSDHLLAWFATEPFRFASSFSVRSSEHARASNQARLDSNPGNGSSASAFFARRYATVPFGESFEYPIPTTTPRNSGRFRGEVFVLVNRHSYSNAVTVAAMIQDYGFGLVLGEKTSDMATTYGAMETFSLPHTGIVVGFPKAHIVRPSGEKHAHGVTPDVSIPSPLVPTCRDVVLDRALAHISARSSGNR